MSKAHELLSRRPFDLYQLHLFRLVAESGSFTRAAQITGLTQSAITRQIQSIELQLGLSLLTRTTRSVVTTAAGKFLVQESGPVLGDVDVLLRRLREEYADAPREVRVGVSKSVSLAYLPGFFAANVRQGPTVISRVTHESSQTILASLESDALDVGVLLPPARLSPRLRITHRFHDAFTFIANADQLAEVNVKKSADLRTWLELQPWLALQDTTQTGRRLSVWLKGQQLQVKPAMELDNFDLIINLVAVGVGVRQLLCKQSHAGALPAISTTFTQDYHLDRLYRCRIRVMGYTAEKQPITLLNRLKCLSKNWTAMKLGNRKFPTNVPLYSSR